MERSMDGRSCCEDCGFIGLHTEWVKQLPTSQPAMNDVERAARESCANDYGGDSIYQKLHINGFIVGADWRLSWVLDKLRKDSKDNTDTGAHDRAAALWNYANYLESEALKNTDKSNGSAGHII
jgi:hypothetical protein